MNDLELIFSMLGEASTIQVARGQDSQGFEQNKQSAVEGGSLPEMPEQNWKNAAGKKFPVKKIIWLPRRIRSC